MFFVEWFIGYFGAENIELITYLFGLFLTITIYFINLIVGWKTNLTIIFFITSIISIISNITDLNNIVLYLIMLVSNLLAFYFLPTKEIKNKIVPNILSLFFIFLVISTGLFTLFDSTNEKISEIKTEFNSKAFKKL